ncbi:stabilizer of axonemal microtubules 2 [Myripristis murdjan]|uniref:stabilizer of axonemal microtubules 2 n=1 Tax=Myripristis murdjan TaxID=586833 RepID=UPI0011761836|nr:stabilizer of axonemal microtubules 2 [Myripristis murdjan]
MKRICICEMCNCGRHRCTHEPTALYVKENTGECMLTEYTEKFPVYGRVYNPPQTQKPKPELDHGRDKGRMDGTTTFKTDFIPHEVKQRPKRQPAEYKPKPGKIDLGTTYKQDFNPYELQPFVPVKSREKAYTAPPKLETIPTYKDDFRQWELCKQELTKPKHKYQPPSSKFGGTTTFQDDFVPRSVAPQQSFKPPSVAKFSDVPFDGVTSNQLAFVAHPVEPRFVKPQEVYKPSSQPLQDLTTNRLDFQGQPGELAQSCKPRPNKSSSLAASDSPFESNTENKDNFKEWPVSLPKFHQPDKYVGPTEHMDLSTTTAAHYVRHQVQPFSRAKPHKPPRRASAPFQNLTTMREDFQPWAAQARQPLIKQSEGIHKASGKIEDLTTFRAHYTIHELKPNISFKPSKQPMRSSVPMEDSTMYRTTFTPKRISVCPASFQSPPGYEFEESDDRGHKYFRKL